MQRAAWMAVVGLLLMAASPSRPAHACSCGSLSFVVPASDEADVPRNPVLLVANAELAVAGCELRRAGTGEVVTTTFELIEGQFDNFDRVWMGQPDELLDAGASYELWVTPENPGEAFVMSEFTVGNLVDTDPPVAPALRGDDRNPLGGR